MNSLVKPSLQIRYFGSDKDKDAFDIDKLCMAFGDTILTNSKGYY